MSQIPTRGMKNFPVLLLFFLLEVEILCRLLNLQSSPFSRQKKSNNHSLSHIAFIDLWDFCIQHHWLFTRDGTYMNNKDKGIINRVSESFSLTTFLRDIAAFKTIKHSINLFISRTPKHSINLFINKTTNILSIFSLTFTCNKIILQ